MAARRERKYALDANVFIDAFRSDDRAIELEAFHAAFTPFEYLSAVVAMELRAGVRGKDAERLERHVLEPFERRGRVIIPSYAAWREAGEVLAAVRGASPNRGRWQAFANDVLLGISCRDAGVTVVTSNARDFERIAALTKCEFVAPWPAPT
jgi:predicted nucleic acid-binding protein